MADLLERSEAGLIQELRFHGLAPLPEPKKPEPKQVGRHVDLKPHQQKAVEELDNGKILIGGVGTGKSRTAVAYYMAKELPRDVVVITTAKKRDSFDWQEELLRFGVGSERDATLTGTTYEVDSWNNLGNYADREGAFFIFDEQRIVGKGSWTKHFLKIARNNRWILLSATPGDNWIDYIPVFIANGFYRTRTEFTREHVVYTRYAKFPKVERYLGEPKLLRLRDSLFVEMPYERHTTRHTHFIPVEYDKDLYNKAVKDRWHVYEERPLRDVAEMFSVMRKVVNSDPSRLSAVRDLMETHPRLIVFYNFNYELEMLRELALEMEGSRSDSCSSEDSTSTTIPQRSTSNAARRSSTSTARTSGSSSSDTQSSAPSRSGTRILSTSESMAAGSFSVAEWNGHKHEPIPTTDRWVYLVQYVAGSEGWNCIDTDSMVFWSFTYSYKNWHQAYGRTDRMNTPFTDLHYYVLRSTAPIDGAIWKSLKDKKSFNERRAAQEFKF